MILPITKHEEGIQFAISVQPRSSRNEIVGFYNQRLKIKLTSPPVDGAANKLCLKVLAKAFGVSPSQLALVKGATSREKVIRIEQMDEGTFQNRLTHLLEKGSGMP